MTKLIFIGEKFGGRVYEFAVPTTSVGRGDHNTLTIHDESVSSTHCEILVYGPEVIVRDLGSRNGTFVNGERLHRQQRELKSGQTVKFGSIEARLELETPSPSSPDTATDITAVHAYSRYLRQQQEEPKKPAAVSMTLESGAATAPSDHTLTLPRPAPAEQKILPPAPEKARSLGKSPLRTMMALLAALALGMAILLWLIWGRN